MDLGLHFLLDITWAGVSVPDDTPHDRQIYTHYDQSSDWHHHTDFHLHMFAIVLARLGRLPPCGSAPAFRCNGNAPLARATPFS